MYRGRPDTPYEQFLDQFEWNGDDWLYRYRMTGPAYRVTDREKDSLVSAFDARQRWFTWIALAVIILWTTAFFTLPRLRDIAVSGNSLYRSFFLYALPPLLAQAVRFACEGAAFRAPLRALNQRKPIAPAWSAEARQRLALDRIPISNLVMGAMASMLGIVAVVTIFGWPAEPLGLLILLVCVGALVWIAVQSVRKWRVAKTPDIQTASSLT